MALRAAIPLDSCFHKKVLPLPPVCGKRKEVEEAMIGHGKERVPWPLMIHLSSTIKSIQKGTWLIIA